MKRWVILSGSLLCLLLCFCVGKERLWKTDFGEEMLSDNQSRLQENRDYIVVGFSQIGSESDWRLANTESFKSTFTEENGYYLIFDDAQQKQENQIKAVRNFILQEVDYIVLDPIVETGWDSVLEEA
ncbi:MAG: LacI family transcriptional regulator, partial [Lachnospiraceae bacterium]|nr:LacI family transcriptional regulator [Lachnospiraceae bacterium]